MPYSLNLSQIQTVKSSIESELVSRASLLGDSMFQDLGMKVTTDVENIDVCYIFNEKGLQARPYVVGHVKDSQLGEFVDNPAKVEKIVLHVSDSIERYSEKGPFESTSAGATNAEHTEFLLRQLAKRPAEDIRANIFFGNMANRKLEDTAENQVKLGLSLFDGFYTKIAQGITDGTISKQNGNYVETGDIEGKTAQEVYEILATFVSSLNPTLQDAETLYIYASKQFCKLAVKGYMLTFDQLSPTVLQAGWRFAEMPNVLLCTSPAMGKGGQLIATTKENLEYVADIRENAATIEIDRVNKDLRVFDYQANLRGTVRIRDYSPRTFAVNDAVNTPLDVPVGDYIADIFTATSADEDGGSVAITSGSKDLYAEGDIITVTATPKDGFKFVGWSDGGTSNPYNYTFPGGVVHLTGHFEEE